MASIGDFLNFSHHKGKYIKTNNSTSQSLSFPSALNRGKNKLVMNDDGSGQASKAFKKEAKETEKFTQTYRDRIPSMNINMSNEYREMIFNPYEVRYDQWNTFIQQTDTHKNNQHLLLENPWQIGGDAMRSMNWYRFKYNNSVNNLVNIEKKGSSGEIVHSVASITPSLFNPKFGVISTGLTWNVPLLIDATGKSKGEDVSDCSIRKLIELSHKGKLGAQRYRYADFMYCKDLGKVANNHLITLRKFAFPVGDVIGEANAPNYAAAISQEPGYMAGDDVARLVTWFDTDDNKLEDILTFQYEYTWKQLESKAQQLDSQENDESRGVLGLFNNLNPDNFRHMNEGTSGPHNLWSKILGHKFESFNMKNDGKLMDRFRMYDNNKVYTEKQAVQDMYIPEGKLKFSNDINLTFSYKLRAYDNINPRSAMLDLIGNILECTYFRGEFWGGRNSIIGPKPNNASYYKVNAFLDNAWDKVGGVLSAMSAGTADIGALFGVLGSIVGEGLNKIVDTANGMMNGGNSNKGGEKKSATQQIGQILNALWSIAGFGQASKAAIKNKLGRPAFYAFDSLLTGEDTGLWHLTVGNPRNPIASMGNMIMTNASIQHFGPLGIDDFPTEIKVKVTLKHARSRDLQQIGKMYTQGLMALYQTTNRHKWSDFYNETIGDDNSKKVKTSEGEIEVNAAIMDTTRGEAQAANKQAQESAGVGSKEKPDQFESSLATDKAILLSQVQQLHVYQNREESPLIKNDGISGPAELSGFQNPILAVTVRDEYA